MNLKNLKLETAALLTDWHHKSLPSNEYPQTVEQLKDAYPGLDEVADVELRVSQFTRRMAVMVRYDVDKIRASKQVAVGSGLGSSLSN